MRTVYPWFSFGAHLLLSFSVSGIEDESVMRTIGGWNATPPPTTNLEAKHKDYRTYIPEIIQLFRRVNASLEGISKRMEVLETQSKNLTAELEQIKAWININSSTTDLGNSTFPDDLWILTMVNAPEARLYSGEDHTGSFEDYKFEKSSFKGGCHNLLKLVGRVRSVDTLGKCVRLFSGPSCEGWSRAIYPGCGTPQKVLNSKLTMVKSIGPCLLEEFQLATFNNETKEAVLKNSSDVPGFIPDMVEFFSLEKMEGAIKPPRLGLSLGTYKLGPQNRTEFLQALIYPKHVNMSQPKIDMGNFVSLDKHPDDLVGYGIPLALGGPCNETFNTFPQSATGKEEWNRVTSDILKYLGVGLGCVELSLNFIYEDGISRRPNAFYYWMKYGTGRNQISYGRVQN